jgi:hypothetical protein
MTQWDEELGLPGNREIVEHALSRSTTQVLHLAEETGPRNRTLAERAADLVRGFECGPAELAARAEPEPPVVTGRARPPGLPDLADELLHAGAATTALLAGGAVTPDRAR